MKASPVRGRPPGPLGRSDRGLTDRQEDVLRVIDRWTREHGYPPSMREIGQAVGLKSTSSVAHQVRSLETMGYLRQDPHVPRCYALTNQAREEYPAGEPDAAASTPVLVPLVGQIAAGTPITAEQHTEQLLPLPREVVGDGPLFAVRVRGDSMIDAGILNGDVVVVRATSDADNGQIVAALIGDEATVKRLKRSGAADSWLMPANRDHQPISAVGARILGVVVAVLRSL